MINAVIFDMDGLILDTEKLLVKYWCQAANEAGFPMQREHALNIRSLARKFAIPYLQGIFGEEFDYVKIRSRRMELMKQHISEHGLETKPGIAELLRNVEKEGSLQGAAQSMNMAYSKAWRIIKDTEETLDVQLLLRDGAHGSTLTEDGNRLLDAYLAIEEHLSAEADRLFKEMTR